MQKLDARLRGSTQEYNATVYVKNVFESYGLTAEIEVLDVYLDQPIESKLKEKLCIISMYSTSDTGLH